MYKWLMSMRAYLNKHKVTCPEYKHVVTCKCMHTYVQMAHVHARIQSHVHVCIRITSWSRVSVHAHVYKREVKCVCMHTYKKTESHLCNAYEYRHEVTYLYMHTYINGKSHVYACICIHTEAHQGQSLQVQINKVFNTHCIKNVLNSTYTV